MVLGTASHVGKSLLTAALCRILAQDGYAVAPFKAQNMSLNSAATPDGGEIGRAQALQAEAARAVASVDMNPILLKPTSESGSQVVVLGRIDRHCTAREYHREKVRTYEPIVHAAYARLASAYDVVVLEGAGSPVELNLLDGDLVNLAMARAADARCLLVADIDRGGVFASLVGTLALVSDADRDRIVGTVVNKFRGDPSLFADGTALLETRTGRPVLGVVPYLHDVGLEEEDALGYDALPHATRPAWRGGDGAARALRVAVVAWPAIANLTDVDALAAEPAVELVYATAPAALAGADVVLVPGTKTTLAALRWLRERGFSDGLVAASRDALVFGICGGMQALGRRIDDPGGVEGGGTAAGLGLLPIVTVLRGEKTVARAAGELDSATLFGRPLATRAIAGYEIHVGETTYAAGARRFARIRREPSGASDDGAVSADERVVGTYLHGAFAADGFRHAFVACARAARGLAPAASFAAVEAERDARIDRLAAHVRAALDVPRLLALAGIA